MYSYNAYAVRLEVGSQAPFTSTDSMQRNCRPERMDDPTLPEALHRQALVGLGRLNAFSDGGRMLLPTLQHWTDKLGRSLRILDVATGAGDGLLPLMDKSRHWTYPLLGAGCDISTTAIDEARLRAKALQLDVEFFQADALQGLLPDDYDVMLSSLFLHHLADEEIANLLRKMGKAARVGVLLNDLVRGRWNRLQVWVASRLVTRSRVVHYDGPVSVEAALTPLELQSLAARAGLLGATVTKRFPCRMVLAWTKVNELLGKS